MKNKIYTFKIFADNETFRVIEIKGEKSLYDLATILLKSFDFGMDHAFGFYNNLEDCYDSDEIYELFADLDDCEVSENVQGVKKTKIHSVFEPQKQMAFLFDYGDEWVFLVECQAISDPVEKIKYPRIIEKVGQSPEQYPEYDEEEEEE